MNRQKDKKEIIKPVDFSIIFPNIKDKTFTKEESSHNIRENPIISQRLKPSIKRIRKSKRTKSEDFDSLYEPS